MCLVHGHDSIRIVPPPDGEPPTTPTRSTGELGCRCAWCGVILRLPCDTGSPEGTVWTHGICQPCHTRVSQDTVRDVVDYKRHIA